VGHLPKIANIELTRLRFSPGDRVLVRVYAKLDKQQKRKLRQSVQKWAGDVEVLIVDMRIFDVEIDSARRIV
jgi:hypothetical protein